MRNDTQSAALAYQIITTTTYRNTEKCKSSANKTHSQESKSLRLPGLLVSHDGDVK